MHLQPRTLLCCCLVVGCGSQGVPAQSEEGSNEPDAQGPTDTASAGPTSAVPQPASGEPESGGGGSPSSGAPSDAGAAGDGITSSGGNPGQSGAGGGVPEPDAANGGALGGTGSTPEPTDPGPGAAGAAGTSEDGDDYVEDVSVRVHEEVATVLVVEWTQLVESDEVWLEFSFEGEAATTSRAKPGTVGAHSDVVLGVPADTDVTVRVVSGVDAAAHRTRPYDGMTGSLPQGLPLPDVLAYDPDRSSPERWLVGSVEDSNGNLPSDYLYDTFWVFVMDRRGRVVWYYADPASNATSSFQRLARDGEYLWIEKRPFGFGGYRGVLKLTLDWEYFEEVEIEGLADCIDVTPEGSVLYDAEDVLRERMPDGRDRSIWDCHEHFGEQFNCYSNTVNYNPADDSILMSFPEPNTVIQIDRASGEVLGQYGDAEGSWAFAPPLETPPEEWGFGFQHFPNITTDGTLVVSSHMPGYTAFEQQPTPNQHAFIEFAFDRENRRLEEVWRYTDGTEWARSRGMAIKLDNGNYLVNYGTGGVVREVTEAKETVFDVRFDLPSGDDAYNKLVGNTFYLDDLYRLNGGPR
jgi:hypothetical protein